MGASGGVYLWKTTTITEAPDARRRLRGMAEELLKLVEKAGPPALYESARERLVNTATALAETSGRLGRSAAPSRETIERILGPHGLRHHADPDVLIIGYGDNIPDDDEIVAEALRGAFPPDIEQETWT